MISLDSSHFSTELSSRPERSEVEGPAVDSSSIKYKWKRPPFLCHPERSRGICSSLHQHRIPPEALPHPLLRAFFQRAQNRQPDLTLAKLSLIESADYPVRQARFLANLDSSEVQA